VRSCREHRRRAVGHRSSPVLLAHGWGSGVRAASAALYSAARGGFGGRQPSKSRNRSCFIATLLRHPDHLEAIGNRPGSPFGAKPNLADARGVSAFARATPGFQPWASGRRFSAEPYAVGRNPVWMRFLRRFANGHKSARHPGTGGQLTIETVRDARKRFELGSRVARQKTRTTRGSDINSVTRDPGGTGEVATVDVALV